MSVSMDRGQFCSSVCVLLLLLSPCWAVFHDSVLQKDLLSNYSYGRPSLDPLQPVNVSISFSLFQIKELDGRRQILSTFGQMIAIWYDPSLSWDPALYGGESMTTIPSDGIWMPVIGIRNSATKAVDPDMSVWPLLVYADGSIVYAPSGSFETSCDLNMLRFPFDTQICSIDIGNFLYTDKVVNLVVADPYINMDFFTPNKEFDIQQSGTGIYRVDGHLSFLPPDDNTIPLVKVSMKMVRKYSYYVMYILLPTIVLSVLSVMIFSVPVDAGEKMGVGITILLSYSVFMLILADQTPQTSDNIPVLAVYLTSVICVTAIALFCSAIVLRIHHTMPVRPMPGWMKTYLLGGLGCLLCVVKKNKVSTAPQSDILVSDYSDDVVSVLKKKQPVVGEEENSQLLREVCKLTKKMKDEEDEQVLLDEWKLLAKVLDKLFFFLFFIVNMLLILTLFVILPYVEA